MGFIGKLLGLGPKTDFGELISQGAQIVDVRTKGEYAGGHIKGSVNIPLDRLQADMNKLKKDKPVITCCASGMRSASATRILKSSGFKDVYNAGGWSSLRKYER